MIVKRHCDKRTFFGVIKLISYFPKMSIIIPNCFKNIHKNLNTDQGVKKTSKRALKSYDLRA